MNPDDIKEAEEKALIAAITAKWNEQADIAVNAIDFAAAGALYANEQQGDLTQHYEPGSNGQQEAEASAREWSAIAQALQALARRVARESRFNATSLQTAAQARRQAIIEARGRFDAVAYLATPEVKDAAAQLQIEAFARVDETGRSDATDHGTAREGEAHG